jgi:hypothetical protein
VLPSVVVAVPLEASTSGGGMQTTRRLSVYVAAIAAVIVTLPFIGRVSTAAWSGSTSNLSNSYSAASLSPPSSLAATGKCSLILVGPIVTLTWNVTPSIFATGYQIVRSATSGGPYTQVGTVSGRGTVAFTDGSVSSGRTYYYVVRATYLSWLSPNSNQASATTPSLCL